MEKLFLAGPKKLAPAVLLELQSAGVVQIDPLRTEEIKEYHLSRDEEDQLRRWDAVNISADHALRLLELEPDSSVKLFAGGLEEAEKTCLPFERRAAALVEKREHLQDELELIGQYREVVEPLAAAGGGLDESRWLSVLPLVLEKQADVAPLEQELASMLENRFLFAGKPVGSRMAAVIIVLKRDREKAGGVLSHQGLAELPRTGEYARMNLRTMALHLAERSQQAPEELTASERDLRQLTEEGGEELRALWNRAKDESTRLHALRDTASGQYGFALFGWVPVSMKSKAMEVTDRFSKQMTHTFEPVDGHHEAEQVPVMLENSNWIKPFEPLITFLNTPRYGTWDPTWVVASFFPLWFGMIVGDIGYALLFIGLAWYLSDYIRHNRTLKIDFFKMRLSSRALEQVVAVMKPMIAWTIVWGFLHGEFFGNLLEKLGVFRTGEHAGLIPVLIPRTDTAATANQLILVSIGFGVFQVLYGFYIKAITSRRQGEKKHFWEASGYFCGVTALVLFSYAFMTGNFQVWFLVATAAGAVLFFVGMVRSGMLLMIAELPTQGGHILSYIRIYAVGLASAILANLVTDMGFSLYRTLGVVGLVLGALAGISIGLFMHVLLLVLLTVSHVLQPIRLIWVEFFTKFDFYKIRGRPYRPFRSVCSSL